MGKTLRYSSLLYPFLLMGTLLMSGCASRGFKLSQQMPGMDNKLNPIFLGNGAIQLQSDGYEVAADGSVVFRDNTEVRDQSVGSDRQVASTQRHQAYQHVGLLYKSPSARVVNSTLDPQNGAVLLSE
jgi:hypothetical protein